MTEKEIEVGDIIRYANDMWIVDKNLKAEITQEQKGDIGLKPPKKIGITTEKLSEILRNSQREHEADTLRASVEIKRLKNQINHICPQCDKNLKLMVEIKSLIITVKTA